MASNGRKKASRQNEDGDNVSVDEIIEIGDCNNMLDDVHSNNKSSYEQNVLEAVIHVSNNEIADYNTSAASLAANIRGKLESAPPSNFSARHCIYIVPEKLRKINESAYTPVLVSIGPFHHGDKRLQAMEQCKLIYMRDQLSRSTEKTGQPTILEECLESIKWIEEEARSCYSEPIKLTSSEFVEMMLVDGLFILEFIFRFTDEEVTYDNDPIFSTTWQTLIVLRDMTLLENQLPMLVLDRLLNVPALQLKGYSFRMVAEISCRIFMGVNLDQIGPSQNVPSSEAKHFLDLVGKIHHLSLHPSAVESSPSLYSVLPSATELSNAGVEFKKGSLKASFLDIKFSNGVLEIPPIEVNDHTDSLLRNLIAHEQYLSTEAVNWFASYTFLMDELINSANDVRLLRKRGIIRNLLGSDEDVAELFNNFNKEVFVTNFYYTQLKAQVNTYYRKRRHVWRATLRRDYFNNPWKTISVVTAFLLVVLTFTATTFAILSFFIHKS